MAKIKSFDIQDVGAPKFPDSYKVAEHMLLNFTDIGSNNNKFYSVELQEANGNFRIFTHYGRVGQQGAKEGRYFFKNEFKQEKGKTLEDCVKEAVQVEYKRILKEKQKKGYVPVDVSVSDVGSGRIQAKSNSLAGKTQCNLDVRVQRFVEQIYQEASKSLANTIRTPLGALSEAQIDKGFEKLEQIRKAIKYDDKKLLVQLSSQFYSLIPQKFYGRIDYDVVINNDEKADRQEELLQLMRDVYNVKGSLDSDIVAKYKAINTTIEALEKSDSEYGRLEYKVESTQSRHHPVKLFINDIFRVDLLSIKGRFNPKKLGTMELFHGSANKNILGILQRGLLIAPPCAEHTGAAFGRGIYFARHSTKSSQYCTRFHQNLNRNGFLFIGDVAVGRMKKVNYYTFDDRLESCYDSAMGVAGADLIHDEYIVYNPNQVEIKYVIDFTPRAR